MRDVAQAAGAGDVQEAFASIARSLREGRSVEEVYQAVADAAIRVIDGCDHAGVALMRNGNFSTASATDAVVVTIDRMQAETGEGPCLDAVVEEAWERYDDIRQGSRWESLTERVVAETPVRSMLAFRLMKDDRKGGALNLYGDRPNAFDDRASEEAAIFASFASVAVAASEQQRRADQLQQGLESNREIGKAIGLIMASHKISSDDAFNVLVRASQTMNRKLADIARDLVEREGG